MATRGVTGFCSITVIVEKILPRSNHDHQGLRDPHDPSKGIAGNYAYPKNLQGFTYKGRIGDETAVGSAHGYGTTHEGDQ